MKYCAVQQEGLTVLEGLGVCGVALIQWEVLHWLRRRFGEKQLRPNFIQFVSILVTATEGMYRWWCEVTDTQSATTDSGHAEGNDNQKEFYFQKLMTIWKTAQINVTLREGPDQMHQEIDKIVSLPLQLRIHRQTTFCAKREATYEYHHLTCAFPLCEKSSNQGCPSISVFFNLFTLSSRLCSSSLSARHFSAHLEPGFPSGRLL